MPERAFSEAVKRLRVQAVMSGKSVLGFPQEQTIGKPLSGT